MTSSSLRSTSALVEELITAAVGRVSTLQLPYCSLEDYQFPDPGEIGVMILCHSIENRRFAITDVLDSLYDEFLCYCKSVLG